MGEFFAFYYDKISIFLIALTAILFLIQIYYYMLIYTRIPAHSQRIKDDVTKPISIVVVVQDHVYYIEEILPKLLSQDYEKFEVIIVDNASSRDITNLVMEMMNVHPNLKYTRINPDPRFTRTRKLSLTVGIKAASYPNILFTEPSCYPTSGKWLSMMAKGFSTGDIVIGYCGIEPQKGLANKIIRCSRMMMSVRYLSAAIGGKTYRGIAQNIGYTSKIYFTNKGFNHLLFNIGDDDLFIQKIVETGKVSVILNPKATTRQYHYGGLRQWMSERKYFSYTFRYYPKSVKASIFTELFTRILFWVAAIGAIVYGVMTHDLKSWIVGASLIILRYLIVMLTVSKIAKRLGEYKLMRYFIIHDILSPFSEAFLCISRRLRPSKSIWN